MIAIQPRCPVCSQSVSGITVSCPRCETGHHADCWTFGGGCAIYGCEKVSRRSAPAKDLPPALASRDRLRGGAFGALLGAGTTLLAWPLLALCTAGQSGRHGELLSMGFAWMACSVVLGWRTGSTVRGRADRPRTLLMGILGPAVAAWGLCVLLASCIYFPFFLVCSLPAVLFALPCALVAERFNEAATDPLTQERLWLAVRVLLAFATVTAAAVATII